MQTSLLMANAWPLWCGNGYQTDQNNTRASGQSIPVSEMTKLTEARLNHLPGVRAPISARAGLRIASNWPLSPGAKARRTDHNCMRYLPRVAKQGRCARCPTASVTFRGHLMANVSLFFP